MIGSPTIQTDQDLLDQLERASWSKTWQNTKKYFKMSLGLLGVGLASGWAFLLTAPTPELNILSFLAFAFFLVATPAALAISMFLFGFKWIGYGLFKFSKQKNIALFAKYLKQNKPENAEVVGVCSVLGIQDLKELRLVPKETVWAMAKNEEIQAFATKIWGVDWASKPIRIINKDWLETKIENLDAKIQVVRDQELSQTISLETPVADEFVLVLQDKPEHSSNSKTHRHSL